MKSLREKLHESVVEVSGAVEIDPDLLVRIEQGEHRPAEDVLLLLISYFDPQDEEALQLWELAGYDQQRLPGANVNANNPLPIDETNSMKPLVMVMQHDNRVMYTDMVNVTINNHGVVMNFLQNPGNTGNSGGQPSIVARVGMSRDHAKSVLNVLQQTLAHTEPAPKSLPPSRQNQPTSDDS